MNIFLIGVGGAGNKAVISAIENEVVTRNNALLLNTTLSDIGEAYRDISIKFGDSRGGCGKERQKAREYIVNGLRGELSKLDALSNDEIELVIIVTSTEGGTGSGSTLMLAKYINNVLGKNVQIFAFNGFEEDTRGLKNTVEFFQEVDPAFSVQCTSNKKFMGDSFNKISAEKASNADFITRIGVLTGKGMIDTDQNIDSTDLFKVSTQIGYTVCNKIRLPKIKNIEQYNKVIKDALDEDQALDTTKTVKRLAMIFNISKDNTDSVDFYANKFKEKFGNPFEVYTHVQYDEGEEYVSYIASGLDLPLDEALELKTYQADDMFNMNDTNPRVSKNDFFKSVTSNSNPVDDGLTNFMNNNSADSAPTGSTSHTIKLTNRTEHDKI